MCNKQASMSSWAGALRRARSVAREKEETQKTAMLIPIVHRVLVPLGRVGSSVAGVMGNESVPDDREVERDTRAEENGVAAREEIALLGV